VRNAKNSASTTVKDDALIAAIKATYSLSKRTALYGLVTAIDNDAGADLAVGGLTGTAGKASHGIAFGVRHQF
jgi:predicted porin